MFQIWSAANQKIIQMHQRRAVMCVWDSELVVGTSWFPSLDISASNKLWVGPELVPGQPFGLRDDSFGLDCGHAGKQLCLFICFDPFLSAAGFLEDYFWGLHMHSVDSHQRTPRDKVAASLSFNYLARRPAFECRSLFLSTPTCHLFEINVTRWMPGVGYEGAIIKVGSEQLAWGVFSRANFSSCDGPKPALEKCSRQQTPRRSSPQKWF